MAKKFLMEFVKKKNCLISLHLQLPIIFKKKFFFPLSVHFFYTKFVSLLVIEFWNSKNGIVISNFKFKWLQPRKKKFREKIYTYLYLSVDYKKILYKYVEPFKISQGRQTLF